MADTLAVQWQLTSPRPPLRVVVNLGANYKVAGSLVLIPKEVVESQVSVGVSNGPVIDEAKPIHVIGMSQISLLPLLWQTPEHISNPLGPRLPEVGLPSH